MNKYYNLITDWVCISSNIARVMEIALYGNLKVGIFYADSENYRKDSMNALSINQFYKEIQFSDNINEIDILIELEPFGFDEYFTRHGESWDDIKKRVSEIKEKHKETHILKFADETSLSLLKTACSRLNLSQIDIKKIFEISNCIAKLSNSSAIKGFHTAEAIQYRSGFNCLPVQTYQKLDDVTGYKVVEHFNVSDPCFLHKPIKMPLYIPD